MHENARFHFLNGTKKLSVFLLSQQSNPRCRRSDNHYQPDKMTDSRECGTDMAQPTLMALTRPCRRLRRLWRICGLWCSIVSITRLVLIRLTFVRIFYFSSVAAVITGSIPVIIITVLTLCTCCAAAAYLPVVFCIMPPFFIIMRMALSCSTAAGAAVLLGFVPVCATVTVICGRLPCDTRNDNCVRVIRLTLFHVVSIFIPFLL